MSHDMTSIDGGIRRRVPAVWRFAPVIAVVSAVLFFSPHPALAKYRDLYDHNTLTASVRFIYSKDKVRSKLYHNDGSGFRQMYSLNMRGKVLSRSFFIYDADVLHSRATTKTKVATGASTTSKFKNTTYHFTTTLIPKSAIPLTLRTGRSTDDTTSGRSTSHAVRREYGLDWSLKFRDLPEILTSYDMTTTDRRNSKTTTQRYKLTVKKDIGVTSNKFDLHKGSNTTSTNSKSSRTSLGYINKTRFSRNTILSANAARNNSSSNLSKTSTTAANMSLNSSPGPDFTQNHNYSFTSTKATTTNESTQYSGNVMYSVTERLSTSLRLNTFSHSSLAGSEKNRTNRTDSADSINYMLTRRLKWVTTASYLSDKSNAPNADLTGANRTRYQLLTGVNYRRDFQKVTTTASYRFGYLEEKSGVTGKAALKKKRGMTQGLSLGLSKMRLWDYALANTAFQYSQAKNMISDSFTDTTFYAADIMNTAGKKYLLAKANYSRKIEDSWIRTLNKKSEVYGINLSTRYFARSSGSVSYNRVNTYAARAAKTSTSEARVKARTQRMSFAGDTTLELEGARSATSQSNSDANSTTALDSLNVKHEFSTLKRTVLDLSMKRFSSSRNKQVIARNTLTDLDLSHKRSLFEGSFVAEYTLNMVKRTHYRQQENYRTHKIVSSYSRRLGGKLYGLASVSKSKSTGTFLYTPLPDETEVNATVYYILGNWVASMEYTNKTSKYTYDTIKSNRLMFSLSRQFIREW